MQEKASGAIVNPEWRQSLQDPVREGLLQRNEAPDLDSIRTLFPPTTGDAAFDKNVIAGNIERLQTIPTVDTGHAFLDLSVKTGLAFIDATFQGDHPKYGIQEYGESYHDGFPPIIIAAVDALSAWGLNTRAIQIFRYWLATFVRADGTIAYPGTSLAELGQLLHTATLLADRADTQAWWQDGFPALDRIAETLLALRREASYTNYRYWPELLSSGILPDQMANRVVDARLAAGGQFCGMTRFEDWLDDWPLADYLYALWRLGRKRDFALSLYGHVAYHQAAGHLTAYEQVTLPPGKKKAAYCLPCQLVAARAARLLVRQ
ncbi:MAG: hypothetical protein M1546_22895 [Chloroflexi bacterium]|nr:hypothetical protein [Chloroflexota bacterium]